MHSLGLIVHDDQSFLTKVVDLGIEQGIFTRDRADEIIRISVAMANKYVLQKEVDFRSTEELAKVQETILKLVGVGLEIKSTSSVEEGVRLLMDASPVDLFRLAYTRIEKLRRRWRSLLLNHRVEIMVSSEEYDCLDELSCQRLAEMSAFSESELFTIQSLTLDDRLFSTLGMVEYYEGELERYEFILRLRDILPFAYLNKSKNVKGGSLSEVDCLREALINTLVVSAAVDAADPVAVSMEDVREFLDKLEAVDEADILSPELEEVVVDLIHELSEGLDEHEAGLLAKEFLEAVRKLVETIVTEWETVASPSEDTFFKRWSRLVILTDVPDPVDRILSTQTALDEFDFEFLIERLAGFHGEDAQALIDRLPWKVMSPVQVTRLFHRFPDHYKRFGKHASLAGFSADDLINLLEGLEQSAVKPLKPELTRALASGKFTLEELELLAAPPHTDLLPLLLSAAPHPDTDVKRVMLEFREGTKRRREVILFSCVNADFFPVFFSEAWSIDPDFVKRQARAIPASKIAPFLISAAGGARPRVPEEATTTLGVDFRSEQVNELFKSLPAGKKKAVIASLSKD
ncbi:MAG: DUF6178 family protein [Desulfomonilaceae bacterium]|nr:DUF6178 family protein [Desulfomonilaceae bacterium]